MNRSTSLSAPSPLSWPKRMHQSHRLFSDSYFTARYRFLQAAKARGYALETALHPMSDQFPADVATDIVRVGPDTARRVFFISSGLHGTELTAGSGIQLGLLEDIEAWLPKDTAAVLIHAVNPFGSAAMTRTDENNIDPNRNNRLSFEPLPENPDYDALHDALCPATWSGPARDAAEARIAAYIAENGFEKYSRNVLSGQYRHADGLFYGGTPEAGPSPTCPTLSPGMAPERKDWRSPICIRGLAAMASWK